MSYSKEILAKVRSMGTLSYTLDRVLILVEPENPEQFIIDFNDKKSEIHKEFEKGVLIAEYQIDKKLFELAKEGDVAALEQLENRKIKRQLTQEDL